MSDWGVAVSQDVAATTGAGQGGKRSLSWYNSGAVFQLAVLSCQRTTA
jgi:hypothetical protein